MNTAAAPEPSFLARLPLAGSAAALLVVAAALWPVRARMGLDHPPAIHPHAPRLDLLARAAPAVQLHLASVAVALGVGVVLLIGVKGTRMHRLLGWAWVLAMAVAAVSSLFIRIIAHGRFSAIHLLAGWTIVALPMAVAAARRHRVALHARFMTGLFVGGLLLAGLLAFIPGRLMWRVFVG